MTDAITIGEADVVKIAGTGADPPGAITKNCSKAFNFANLYQFIPN
jgi:hypothetical protein